MRIQHWITAMGGSFVLLIAATCCHAQGGGGAVIVDGYAPPDAGFMGSPDGYGGGYGFQPTFNNSYHPEVFAPQGAPQMAPWPAISPFEPANVGTTTHMEKNGLWFREMLFRDRDVTFSLEYIHTTFSNPSSSTVGSPVPRLISNGLRTFVEGVPVDLNGEGIQLGLGIGSISVGRGVWPFPFRRIGTPLSTLTAPISPLDASVFPTRYTGDLQGKLTSSGIRSRFGYQDEDGSGWMLNGYYAPGAATGFHRGQTSINGVPITQAMIIANPLILSSRWGSLPLDDGVTEVPGTLNSGFRGSTVKMDVLFAMSNKTESAGASLNHYMNTWIKGEASSITPFMGARYMYIGDQFNFHGIDSGTSYITSLITFRPLGAATVAYPLMDSQLQSSVDSHLFGPQFGFKTELGSTRNFRVWGETNFGLMINHERFNVEGVNIGDPLFHADNNGILTPNEMFDLPNNRFRTELTSFSTKESRTHLSPLFEQSVNAEIGLGGIMPKMAKTALFENATLQVGYTMTAIAFASRASSSIAWRGFPLYPGIKTDYQSFLMHQFNLGLNWEY